MKHYKKQCRNMLIFFLVVFTLSNTVACSPYSSNYPDNNMNNLTETQSEIQIYESDSSKTSEEIYSLPDYEETSSISDYEKDILNITMDDFMSQVYLTATPPKDIMISEELQPGSKTPTENLMRASDEFIGRNVSFRLNPKNTLVFAFYTKRDNQKEALVLIYSDSDFKQNILVVLETNYKNTKTFLDAKEFLKGRICNVEIIDAFDYIYPLNALSTPSQLANDNSEGCYGKWDTDAITALDSQVFKNANVFEDVYSRFEIDF